MFVSQDLQGGELMQSLNLVQISFMVRHISLEIHKH